MSTARRRTMPDPIPAPLLDTSTHLLDVQLAQQKETVAGIKEDMHGLDRRVGDLEQEMRKGFQGISHEVGKMTQEFTRELNRATAPKGIQWPMVSIMVVLALAMASWANSYFGQGIAAATKEAQIAHSQWTALNARVDTISNRQHTDAVSTAREDGVQEANAKWSERERNRLMEEIDRLRAKANSGG